MADVELMEIAFERVIFDYQKAIIAEITLDKPTVILKQQQQRSKAFDDDDDGVADAEMLTVSNAMSCRLRQASD
ncbi:unnamed protein product [Ceratitis capitata]|uniref:(Mediterranean fruit fly) hypothetical protein n=1 Tax=Ceratitis capitata TaxID=7213 RepID=A0A811UZK3_CERCA|nr:unnamed protein product [Ceratitis capitata]